MCSQPPHKVKCIQCGKCCRTKSIDISWTDILRWNEQERYDILSEVSYIKGKGFDRAFFEKSLKKKDDLNRHCPFLDNNNLCTIHSTKPRGCKEAPLGYKTFDECPVFKKPPNSIIEAVSRAQTLDIMMVTKNLNIAMSILIGARNKWLN